MAAESLRQVVELFPGPALVLGPGGEILGANDRAERWIDRVAARSSAGRWPGSSRILPSGWTGSWRSVREAAGRWPGRSRRRGATGQGGSAGSRGSRCRPGPSATIRRWWSSTSSPSGPPTRIGAPRPGRGAGGPPRGGPLQGHVPRPARARPAQPRGRHQRRPACGEEGDGAGGRGLGRGGHGSAAQAPGAAARRPAGPLAPRHG